MNKDNGGPAFPVETSNTRFLGMSLRDHFAIESLHSLVSTGRVTIELYDNFKSKQVADLAYIMADAMLEARK